MRRAIITGGQSGLGAACADRLRADGIDVITFDVSPDADYRVDVTDAASIAAAVAAVGPVDILINSAGIVGPNKPLVETDPAAWERTFDVNVHGTFRVIQAVVPGMVERGWGRIVNIASMAGKDGNPNLSAYSASKAAVIGLTKSLGKELAKTGVLVNVDRAGRDRHPDERGDRAGRARAHHLADPDGPGRQSRRRSPRWSRGSPPTNAASRREPSTTSAAGARPTETSAVTVSRCLRGS